ncbi:MAG: murein biosynthesis integral membrane protein MurJ [Clostridia bacterium]
MGVAHKTAKTVLIVLIINMFSRAVALVASSMITAFYGATAQTSAYSFAIVVTNTVTTVIGTALTTAVIPIFIELMENRGKERAYKFINDTISLTVLMGLLLTVVGAVAAPYIVSGVRESSFEFAVYSIRLMLPAIIFISLFFVFSGVLQASGKFYMAAMVSIPSSFINIVYIVTMSNLFGIKGLVAATLTGFAIQALILIPAMKRAGFVFRLSFDYKSEDIIRIFRLAGPVIIGVCAYQINLLTNSSIAISYNSEKYVILNYMQNLGIQVILTLIYAITSVMYPKLAAYAASKDMEGFKKNLSLIIKAVVLLLLPVTVGFILLSVSLIDIVYGYKKFGVEDVQMGASIFSLYAIGIIGIGFKEIIDRAFYSIKNTKIPAYNGVFIMVVNIVLSFILVQYMGLRGIALAYSIAALAGGAALIILVQKNIGGIGLGNILIIALKAFAACVVMGFAVIAVGSVLQLTGLDSSKVGELICLMIQSGVGAVVYGFCLYILKVQEFMTLKNIIRF